MFSGSFYHPIAPIVFRSSWTRSVVFLCFVYRRGKSNLCDSLPILHHYVQACNNCFTHTTLYNQTLYHKCTTLTKILITNTLTTN